MAQLTDFGLSARVSMLQKGMSMATLAERITKETGMFCDAPYLSRIFHGQRSPDRIIDAVKIVLEI